jgi:hypothetical protein
MRSPAPLVLVVVPLLACFADIGGTATVTATADMTTGGATSTTDGETAASTTTGDGSGEPTTGEPTTTTEDPATTVTPTTGPVDNCEVSPECQAGAVEDGALCDPCGVQRRTCLRDCTWSPMACEQDPATCEYWVLPTNEKQWQRVPVDPNGKFGPTTTVLAAIALPPQQEIYVLTADTYHVFSTPTRTWVGAGERAAIFPQMAGLPLFHATGLTTQPPDTIVTIVAGTEAFSYNFVAVNKTFEFVAQKPCCGEDWTGPNAPDPYSVRDGYSRLGDPDGWINANPQALCGLDEPQPLYGYNLSVGEGRVYPQDIGYCFDFYPPVEYLQFTPFTFPGAPPNELVGGVEYLDGLWIFRGE